MAPSKRALFSLNLDSNADHVYQRVDDHNKEGTDKVKVFESSGPTVGNTKLQVVTKPFETLVDRAVEGVIEGSGKKLHSVEGDVVYETHREDKGSSHRTVTVHKDTARTRQKKKKIEDEYDTSEL